MDVPPCPRHQPLSGCGGLVDPLHVSLAMHVSSQIRGTFLFVSFLSSIYDPPPPQFFQVEMSRSPIRHDWCLQRIVNT
jgi:hypothetical protein